MKKVKNIQLRYAVWALLMIAMIACSNIPAAIAQDQNNGALLKQQLLDQIAADKARFVEGLVGRWISLTGDGGAELRSGLMRLSDDRLADASSADSMFALDKILFETDDLGDVSADLVFNKLTPCRIIDTRSTSGGHQPLLAGVTRSFDAQGPYDDQGGFAGSCGVPGTDPAALMIILVAVNAEGVGNLRAFPKDDTVPNAVVINYNSSNNLANTVVIPLKQGFGDALEFSLRANISDTDVVADVIGYFSAPSKTPLTCVTNKTALSLAPNTSWDFTTASCPSGMSLTGGGVFTTPCASSVWITGSAPSVTTNSWHVRGRNSCGSTTTVTAYAICCQIPGL